MIEVKRNQIEKPKSDGVLTIDLRAIRNNWLTLKGHLRETTECAAVVKANAYGLGVEKVVPNLYGAGCRTFFVATITEGIDIRHLLPADTRVFVLGGFRGDSEVECITHNLIPVLFSEDQLRKWKQLNHSKDKKQPCAIKIDTGMGRLGLALNDFERVSADSDLLLGCNPILLMSHLACADEPMHQLNELQFQRFKQQAERVRKLLPNLSFSLCNSSGVMLGADWHFDLVRPGVAIYGVNPQPEKQNIFESVVKLNLPIIQIREADPESYIGYGATYQVKAKTRIAVVFGGYADGIHRVIGNRGYGVYKGYRVPVVGRISMDSTVFDIGRVPAEVLGSAENDTGTEYGSIQLIGSSITVDDVAKSANTIGYEILTSLGSRYHRNYINDCRVKLKP